MVACCSLLVNDPLASENEKGLKSLLEKAALCVQTEKPNLRPKRVRTRAGFRVIHHLFQRSEVSLNKEVKIDHFSSSKGLI